MKYFFIWIFIALAASCQISEKQSTVKTDDEVDTPLEKACKREAMTSEIICTEQQANAICIDAVSSYPQNCVATLNELSRGFTCENLVSICPKLKNGWTVPCITISSNAAPYLNNATFLEMCRTFNTLQAFKEVTGCIKAMGKYHFGDHSFIQYCRASNQYYVEQIRRCIGTASGGKIQDSKIGPLCESDPDAVTNCLNHAKKDGLQGSELLQACSN